MEKQIFIPTRWLRHNTYCCTDSFREFHQHPDCMYSRNSSEYYTILGIVNEVLADKANCKEIITVAFKVIDDDLEGGYEITYLESEMVAHRREFEIVADEYAHKQRLDKINLKSNLESAWDFSFQQTYAEERGLLDPDDHLNFEQWFNENFKN